MAFNNKLVERVRDYLKEILNIDIDEKKMFGGLAFMVNGKMCINVSGENLMCRFDANREFEISNKLGYTPMIMGNRKYKGYCYVEPKGFESLEDFKFWIHLCLNFNEKAKSSKTRLIL